ncbi:hypothetical protein M717_11435 [Neisseria gonorrhoeae SK33414]|uniref:Uncharacterized protein n=2 Tax=Neisseria gonorrhoeae TaxID=485 RepID=A0AA44U9Z3_NEIGO|nr:Hypothetical protein NGK_0736 [Neisseria gonorrhoeae NCCP11945]APW52965.1 hypothetical protein T556_03350 [Neisseria gonorrhoeae NG-k51.05]EFE04562.1 conserved hypothetical protein [Neisseria gonorrhoeae DGI2]KLR76077.1 hypothetical protein M717_11435 [Neisseria gonorrhoeae SK33414]KLR77757.1 hypothetical protein M680_02710 [Neisseria gonorrhoeae SK8976]KLR81806.1 hypothetical protein M679_07515 [Neisseria gonorrhoeae SK7842]KLR83916.1 hypothetical protein M684_02130 [Neisseria gonorrhoeae
MKYCYLIKQVASAQTSASFSEKFKSIQKDSFQAANPSSHDTYFVIA